MNDQKKPTLRKRNLVEPISVTVTLEFSQVNENGNFSILKLIDGPEWMRFTRPLRGGGTVLFGIDEDFMDKAKLKKLGLAMEEEGAKVAKEKNQRKLF